MTPSLEGRERENASSNNNQQLTTKTIQATYCIHVFSQLTQ
jgi:hypothetical protein